MLILLYYSQQTSRSGGMDIDMSFCSLEDIQHCPYQSMVVQNLDRPTINIPIINQAF